MQDIQLDKRLSELLSQAVTSENAQPLMQALCPAVDAQVVGRV